ncbi:MAG: Xaa-Pro peptidase family protein [Chloroflexota bacterium]
MKSDIDNIMKQRNLDALLVTGPGFQNPDLVYFIGGSANLTSADIIKPRDGEPTLFCNPMERDEAARTGLKTREYKVYDWQGLMKQADNDHNKAHALRYQLMFADMGITRGRIGLAGKTAVGEAYATFSELQKLMPELILVGESEEDSALLRARITKDTGEIEHIRRVGKITTTVVGMVADFLTSQKAKDGVLVTTDGTPLSIGDVKSRINLWLAERGAENPEGTIFSIGYDSALCHSAGINTDYLRLGQTIVFDIFPCESGGGYFYDFTRTWCLGYASERMQAVYNDVYSVFNTIMCEVHAGVSCGDLQQQTCKLFEERGHPTVKKDPKTINGYVHSLGHGLGLNIHELPWYNINNSKVKDTLAAGMVTTIEPGLYYPEESIGVRLEDSVYIRPDGSAEILAPYPYDFILPIQEI